jgi:hypothetical protein
MPLNIGSAGVTIPPGGGYETAAEALSRMGAAAKLAEPALRRFASKEVPASGEEAIAQRFARDALKALSPKSEQGWMRLQQRQGGRKAPPAAGWA